MRKILSISFLLSLSAGAQEAPQVFRDWVFEKKNFGAELGDVCMAYTDKKVGENIWRLHLVYSPAKKEPTFVAISSQDPTLQNSLIYSQTDSSQTIQKHYRSDFLDAALGNKVYWFAPSSFANFYKYLRRGSALKVKYTQDTEKQIYFSLMGSTAATNKISELCNNKKEFVPEVFYDYVDKLNVTALPVSAGASVANAWNDLGASWDSYLESGVHQAALNDLQKKIDPLVAREKEFLRQSGLLSTEIKNQEKAKADLEALLITQKAQLKKAQDDLALQEPRLQAALVVLKNKEDTFRPVREEAKPYFSAVESAKQRVFSLNSQVLSTQEQIRQIKIRISDLWEEVTLTENKIRSQQQQLSQLRTDRIRANNEYQSFNVEWEFQRKLSSDFFYQQKLRAKEQSDGEIIRKRDVLDRKEAKLRDAQRELRECQNVEGKDCSAQQREVNEQKNEVKQAEKNYEGELDQNRRLERDIADRKSQLRRITEEEKRDLANKVSNIDIKISQIESAISQNEFKLSTLRNSDIPRAERELSSAESTLSTQQSQLEIARDSLRRTEQDLASFKIRSDYDRKEREYVAADNEVRAIRSTMASLDLQIQSLNSSISKNEAKIVSIANNIEKLVSDLASTQTELQSIQAALAPLFVQKDGLTLQLQAAQLAMKEKAEDFRVNIRDIVIQKSLEPRFPAKFHDWL